MELFHNIKNKVHDASGVEFPNNWYWDVDNLRIDSSIYYPVRVLTEDELHEETRDFIEEEGLPAYSLDELMVETDEGGEDSLMSLEQLHTGQIYMDMFTNHVEPKEERTTREEVEWMVTEIWMSIGCDKPANHEKIVEYCVEDVEAAADPDNFHSGDVAIAFRRFLEKDLN
jgi:hypothetical protein